jgi:hypothetical protein
MENDTLYINLAEVDPLAFLEMLTEKNLLDTTDLTMAIKMSLHRIDSHLLNKYLEKLLKHWSKRVRDATISHLNLRGDRKIQIERLCVDDEIRPEIRKILAGLNNAEMLN